MTVLVRGGTTNKSFLLDLLDRPEVRRGDIDTAWLDRLTAADEHLPTRLADVALVAAAHRRRRAPGRLDRAAFLGWASRGRPQADVDVGREVELRHGGQSYRVDVRRIGPATLRGRLDGRRAVVVDVERLGRARSRLAIGGAAFAVVVVGPGQRPPRRGRRRRPPLLPRRRRHRPGARRGARRRRRRRPGRRRRGRRPPRRGRGDEDGDRHHGPGRRAGARRVRRPQRAGRRRGAAVPHRAARATTPTRRVGPPIDLAARPGRRAGRPRARLTAARPRAGLHARLRRRRLGAPRSARRTTAAGSATRPTRLAILDAFADLCALAPERRDPDADGDDARPRASTSTPTCARSTPSARACPLVRRPAAARPLAHYGVTEPRPDARARGALLRIFVAQQRRDEQLPIVMRCSTRSPSGRRRRADAGLRETLDRLIDATQRRYPAIASIARAVRHRRFDRPHIEQRARRGRRRRCERSPPRSPVAGRRPGRHARRLVACPLPLMPILAEEDLLADADRRARCSRCSPAATTRSARSDRRASSGSATRGAARRVRPPRPHGPRRRRSRADRRRARRRARGRGRRVAAGSPPPDTSVVDVYLAARRPAELGDRRRACRRERDAPLLARSRCPAPSGGSPSSRSHAAVGRRRPS